MFSCLKTNSGTLQHFQIGCELNRSHCGMLVSTSFISFSCKRNSGCAGICMTETEEADSGQKYFGATAAFVFLPDQKDLIKICVSKLNCYIQILNQANNQAKQNKTKHPPNPGFGGYIA